MPLKFKRAATAQDLDDIEAPFAQDSILEAYKACSHSRGWGVLFSFVCNSRYSSALSMSQRFPVTGFT
jgi:hypothetical protein